MRHLSVFYLVFLLACSGASPPPSAPTEGLAVLDVGNRTEVVCEVYWGPARILVIPPGAWTSAGNLPPGSAALRARCGERVFSQRVDLKPDRASPWIVGGSDRALPPEPGRLYVHNSTPFDFDLRLGRRLLGSVLAGGGRLFPGLTAGTEKLVASERKGRGTWEIKADIVSGERTEIDLKPASGRVKLTNDTHEPARFRLGARLVYYLSPGQSEVIKGLSPGTWNVQVRLLGSRRDIAGTVAIRAGVEAGWSASSEPSSMRVVNGLDEEAEVSVPGKGTTVIPARSEHLFEELPAGDIRFQARGRKTGLRLEKSEVLIAGAEHRWVLNLQKGTLTLVNSFGDAVDIYLDGARGLSLASGAEINLSMEVGLHEVHWVHRNSGSARRRQVQVRSESPARLVFGPGSARLRVINELNAPLKVYLDGRFQAALPAGEEAEICGLMTGRHLVEAVVEGPKARALKRRLRLTGRRVWTWKIRRQTFRMSLDNRTGEMVRFLGDFASEIPSLAPGETRSLSLETGTHKFVAEGKVTGTVYRTRIQTTGVKDEKWVLEAPTGTISVTNRSGSDAMIFLNGKKHDELKDGDSLRIGPLPPGRHSLTAQAARSSLGGRTFRIRAGSEHNWVLQPSTGRIRVVNRTSDELELRVDGQVAGRLGAGVETTLKNLPAEAIRLEARHPLTGAAQEVELVPSSTRPPSWFVEPLSGQVKLLGLRRKAATVMVDDDLRREIPEGSMHAYLALSPGWHGLQISIGDKLIALRVRVFPGQVAAVDLQARRFVLEVRNKGEVPLKVQMDDQVLGSVPPGKDVKFQDLFPGARVFRARAENGKRSWYLRDVRFQGGKVYHWTLPEPPR